MEIRVMTAADYARVYALWQATPGMGLNPDDDTPEAIARYLQRNPGCSFVAEAGGKLAGAILAGHDGRRGYLYHAAVLPEFRGQGIGQTLVDRAMEALQREGIHKVGLYAYTENRIGNEFWEHLGFRVREDLSYRNKFVRDHVK